MKHKDNIRKSLKEMEDFIKMYPTCKFHWDSRTKRTTVYICDSVKDNVKIIGFIK